MTAASILCVVAQAGAIYFVFKLNDETTTNFDKEGAKYCESDDTDYFLRLICLVTFVATCACDFKESFHYFQYILRVPMRNGSEQETDALNEVKTSLATKHVVVKDSDGNEHKLEVSAFGGFSRWEQLVALGWGLIKFAMEVGLVVAGSGYVLHADSNENLLLNSVALAFVSQIDDVAYNFAVTSAFKTYMRALPQFGLIFSGDDNLPYKASIFLGYAQFLGSWFQVFFLLGLSAMLWTVHC